MELRELMPWRKTERAPLSTREGDGNPFATLRKEMNRVFDNFFSGLEETSLAMSSPFDGRFSPKIELSESDSEYKISAELPGVNEKDVDISVSKDALTISGEKRSEHSEEKGSFKRTERFYGSFHRVIPLNGEVDTEKAEASYKNGVLTITLPKSESAKSSTRRIEVK